MIMQLMFFLVALLCIIHPGQGRQAQTLSAAVRAPYSFRGGATAVKKDDLKAYRLQQQLYLQSRSLLLRQALIDRGLDALQHGETEKTVSKAVDWDCTIATADDPKVCLYSFDAEVGAKVVAPIDTDQWITLTALNRLRRIDPSKVEPLWHGQYSILRTWFRPDSSFSLYNHLTPVGTVLSILLDAPVLLGLALFGTVVAALLLTLPVWERLLSVALTSKILWLQWPNWARFVHAALPLKLLLGQMAWKAIAVAFTNIYNAIRARLIEWECKIWQECIPLTIIPKGMDDREQEEEESFGVDDE